MTLEGVTRTLSIENERGLLKSILLRIIDAEIHPM